MGDPTGCFLWPSTTPYHAKPLSLIGCRSEHLREGRNAPHGFFWE